MCLSIPLYPQPGGKAVALLLVPTMHSGDSRVFLWGQGNVYSPVHIFSGHSEAVLDLQWLNSQQLATWSKDRTVRTWAIDKHLRKSLGGGSPEASVDDSSLLASTDPAIDLSLEDSGELSVLPHNTSTSSSNEQVDLSMSLPILKPALEGHSPISHGSPATRSLVALPQAAEVMVSPVFQPLGTQSLSQEFDQLRAESIPNLEIERVSS